MLPPRVAGIQVIIIPTGLNAKTTPEERSAVVSACRDIEGVSCGCRACFFLPEAGGGFFLGLC